MGTLAKLTFRWEYLILLSCILSCSRLDSLDERISSLTSRVEAAEACISAMNDDVEVIRVFSSAVTISSVSTVENGYEITLSNGEKLSVTAGSEGIGKTPLVTVSDDGYWMVDYQDGAGPVPLTSGGEKVKAVGQDGKTPVFSVDSEGYWAFDYGSGPSALVDGEGNRVKASEVESFDPLFSDVSYDAAAGLLTVTLRADGKKLSLPVVPDFMLAISEADGEQYFRYSQTRVYPVETKGIGTVAIQAPEGWTAVLESTSLSVTAPAVSTKAVSADTDKDIVILATSSSGKYATFSKVRVSISDDPLLTYDNYYDMWKDGHTIEAGGMELSMAADGEGTLLSAENSKITADGVYFVPSDVTVSLDCGSSVRKLVIIGNGLEKRSTVVQTKAFNLMNSEEPGECLVYFNVDVRQPAANNVRSFALAVENGGKFDTVIYDNCVLDFPNGFSYSSADGETDKRSIGRFIIDNSKIKLFASAYYIIQIKTRQEFDYIRICNSTIWCNEGINSSGQGIYLDNNPTGSTVEEIVFVNNTMVNVIPASGFFRIKGCQKATIQNNILYVDGEVGAYRPLYNAYGVSGTYNGYPPERYVSGNYGFFMSEEELGKAPAGSWKIFNNDGLEAAAFVTGTSDKITNMRGVTGQPFSEKNYETGDFIVRTGQAYSNAGAVTDGR